MTSTKPITAVLISVGGSRAPILFTLRKHRPRHVWYFCSADSRNVADDIQAQLDWHPDRDLIEVVRFEELGPCYNELRQAIPGLLGKWRVAADEVLVDYTCGTKTMSAALVLAATELFGQFSYIGGEQREKSGLGITVDGKEKIIYQANPWKELAVREIERARDLWAGAQYEAAAGIFRELTGRMPRRVWFETLAELGDACAARHRLDFKSASRLLADVRKKIRPLCDGRDLESLIGFVEEAHEICRDCSEGAGSPNFVRELLDNALRTAEQRRFEDAAARLYRAMEMQGQLWLSEKSGGVFQNGKLKPGMSLPAALEELPFCRPDQRGEVRLSLEQLYLALDRLGEERAAKVVEDLKLGPKSRWRQATEQRNASILAHGVKSIGVDGFESMRRIASDFLGFNLEAQAHPIPPLELKWFS